MTDFTRLFDAGAADKESKTVISTSIYKRSRRRSGIPVRVLLIEDDADYAVMVKRYLGNAGEDEIHFCVENAARLSVALERLAQEKFDIVLSDLGLPDSLGLNTFEKIHSLFPDIPVVLLTGLEDKDLALEAVHRGAQEYLMKDRISGETLIRVIQYSMERHRLLAKLEKSLKEVKLLRGMLPICAWCKNVRDDKGYWKSVEAYITEHSEVEFTHGICPECSGKLKKRYPDSLTGEIPTDDESR